MENFCKDELWTSSVSWNTSNPNLSQCLRDTICPLLSCLFLWTCLPFWYFCSFKNQNLKLQVKSRLKKVWHGRITSLFFAKFCLNLVVIVNNAGELAWRHLQNDLVGSEIFYPVIMFCTCLLAILILIGDKLSLTRSSIPLSLFWPFLALCILPNVKVEIEMLLDEFNISRFVLTLTLLPSCCLLSLAQLWPDMEDLEPAKDQLAPNNLNSFWSSVFLSWLTPLIWMGYKQPLSQKDLYFVPSKVDVDSNVDQFQIQWQNYLSRNGIDFKSKQKRTKSAKLWIPLLRTFGWRFALANALGLVHYSVTFGGPQILKQLIALVENPQDYLWKGYLFSVLLFVVYALNTIFFTTYLVQMYSVAIGARSVVISAIMRKMLKLSNSSRQKFTLGQITNLVSVDAQRLMESIPYLCILWAAPYQVGSFTQFTFALNSVHM